MKADFSETLEMQQKLTWAADAMTAMAGEVAVARQVREYDGDRRKRCLALAAIPLLKSGASSAAADTEARASEVYSEAMKQLGNQLVAAEKVIATWEATKVQWESARSLLSMSKATFQNL